MKKSKNLGIINSSTADLNDIETIKELVKEIAAEKIDINLVKILIHLYKNYKELKAEVEELKTQIVNNTEKKETKQPKKFFWDVQQSKDSWVMYRGSIFIYDDDYAKKVIEWTDWYESKDKLNVEIQRRIDNLKSRFN